MYREYDDLNEKEQEIVRKDFINKKVDYSIYTYLVTNNGLIDLRTKVKGNRKVIVMKESKKGNKKIK